MLLLILPAAVPLIIGEGSGEGMGRGKLVREIVRGSYEGMWWWKL